MLPLEAICDLMVVTTGTRRMWPLRNVGPLTDECSLTSDWDNQWLTGGLEPDVITEATWISPPSWPASSASPATARSGWRRRILSPGSELLARLKCGATPWNVWRRENLGVRW